MCDEEKDLCLSWYHQEYEKLKDRVEELEARLGK
jgi:hypothetical protein